MSEWKETELRKHIIHKKGFAFKSSIYQESGRLIVRVSDTTMNSVNVSSCVKIDESLALQFKDYELEVNDIVIMTVGSWPDNPTSVVGKVIRIPKQAEGALLNQNSVRIRTNNTIDKHFLYYKLKSNDFSGYIENTAQGSANQASITLEDIFNYKFLLPSLNEQKAISNVLKIIDDKIDLQNSQNSTLEKMAETLFRQWFVEEAKEEWKEGTLDDILSVKGGTTPSTSEPNYWNGKINWTSPRDITNLKGIYLFDTERKITELGLSKISSGLLAAGTLLMSSRAPVGVLAFSVEPVAINQGYIAILDNKGYSKEFIYLWLKTNIEVVHSFSNGSTFMEISKSAFKTLQLLIPPKHILDNFQMLVKPLFGKNKI